MPIISVWYDEGTGLTLGGGAILSPATHDGQGNPIIKLDHSGSVPGRYTHQVDLTDPDNPALVEPDPAVVEAVMLPEEQDAAVSRLWQAVDRFISNKPNGRPRYDHNFMAAANALDKSAMTAGQLAKYQAVFDWVDAVWSRVYYPTKAALDGATTLAGLEAATWDLSPFEVGSGQAEADPDVSLLELRS